MWKRKRVGRGVLKFRQRLLGKKTTADRGGFKEGKDRKKINSSMPGRRWNTHERRKPANETGHDGVVNKTGNEEKSKGSLSHSFERQGGKGERSEKKRLKTPIRTAP